MKKLHKKDILIMGGALFSMHFGAGCMIYPMTWGKESGSAVYLAYLGVFLSGILLTFLGYTALSRGKDTFWGLTKQITPKFGTFFCAVIVLLVGPLYIIPRMSASAWEAIEQLLGKDLGKTEILFHLAIFAVIFWFVVGKVRVTDKIGKILTPVQLLIVLAVVIKGIATPVSAPIPAASYEQPPFVYGFLQAYSTGDLQCALLFGAVLISDLQKYGLEGKNVQKNLLSVGVVGLGLLALIHLGHMMVGARVGSSLPLRYAALYAQVTVDLWGKPGGVLFAIALVTAVLSCGVGLTASNTEYFAALLHQEKHTTGIVAVICAVSAAISCMGLTEIMALIGPLLDACFPSAIWLVTYYTFMPDYTRESRKRGLRWAMITAFIFGLLHMLYVYNGQYALGLSGFVSVYEKLPLAIYNFAWLPVSLLAFAAGSLTGSHTKKAELSK